MLIRWVVKKNIAQLGRFMALAFQINGIMIMFAIIYIYHSGWSNTMAFDQAIQRWLIYQWDVEARLRIFQGQDKLLKKGDCGLFYEDVGQETL